MTGSPIRLPPRRETGTEDADDHLVPLSRKQHKPLSISLPVNRMRRTAPASRPYGRGAVGLRPSLDPDAYFDAPSQDQEAPKQAKANAAVVLTRPRSFRNDLRKRWI